jgi:ribosome biogenesis GTPase A
MEEKPKRSYAKASYKTKPFTVRFDTEKFDFFMSRQKLKTAQQLVDYFLNKFWWENKVAEPTHKEVPPIVLRNEPEVSQPIQTVRVRKTPQQWVLDKRDLDDQESYQKWFNELESDPYLTSKEKQAIKMA